MWLIRLRTSLSNTDIWIGKVLWTLRAYAGEQAERLAFGLPSSAPTLPPA